MRNFNLSCSICRKSTQVLSSRQARHSASSLHPVQSLWLGAGDTALVGKGKGVLVRDSIVGVGKLLELLSEVEPLPLPVVELLEVGFGVVVVGLGVVVVVAAGVVELPVLLSGESLPVDTDNVMQLSGLSQHEGVGRLGQADSPRSLTYQHKVGSSVAAGL